MIDARPYSSALEECTPCNDSLKGEAFAKNECMGSSPPYLGFKAIHWVFEGVKSAVQRD